MGRNESSSEVGLSVTGERADMAGMVQPIRDRRVSPRRRVDLPSGLKISSYGENESPRKFAAKLVDVNETGIGVDMFVPLVVGSAVTVAGDLYSSDYSFNIQGKARVVYCRCEKEGMFRVGLAYEQVAYRKIA